MGQPNVKFSHRRQRGNKTGTSVPTCGPIGYHVHECHSIERTNYVPLYGQHESNTVTSLFTHHIYATRTLEMSADQAGLQQPRLRSSPFIVYYTRVKRDQDQWNLNLRLSLLIVKLKR